MQWPDEVSLLHYILEEAPQAPGGRCGDQVRARTKAISTAAFIVGTQLTFYPHEWYNCLNGIPVLIWSLQQTFDLFSWGTL